MLYLYLVIKYNFSEDLMTISGEDYALSPFRKWLLANHEQLCNGHFIKSIRVGDRMKFTYDWQHIYFVAEQYEFTKIYINDSNPDRKTPPTDSLPVASSI